MTDVRAQHAAPQRPLPPGWRWVRLGEVVREAQAGFAAGERDPNGVIQLRMNNVTNRGDFDWSAFLRVPADSATIAAYRLQRGDVLFNNTNSTDLVGKSALFESYGEPVVFSNHFTRLRTFTEKIEPSFLALWLRERWQQRVFANICNRWIGQSAVQRDKLLGLLIPLPPLPEQQRIVAILSEQMAAVEKARTATESQLEAAKALPAAYLRAVFNSPEAQEWPRKRLGDVCEEHTGTRDPRLEEKQQFVYVDITSVDNVKKRIVNPKTLPCTTAPSRARQVIRNNDVILSTTRPNLNAVAIVPQDLDNEICSTGFCVLRSRENLNPSYLFAFVQSHEFVQRLSDMVKGALYPAVTDNQVREQLLPLPPLAEQRRIVAVLSKQMAAVEKARQALEAQQDAINKLPSALLRRAFNGEI